MRTAMPYLPTLHTEAEDHRYFRKVVAEQQVWVADEHGTVQAFIAFTDSWVNHLYVHPDFQSRGAGSMLLEQAKRTDIRSLDLWAFQKNTVARRFYERRGFRLVKVTDGSGNEEREPDVLYRWTRPERPLQ